MLSKLNNRQFVTVIFILMFCGIVVLGYDYFLTKKTKVYQQMSIVLSEDNDPDVIDVDNNEIIPKPVETPPVVNPVETPEEPTEEPNKEPTVVYKYVGRLIIEKIKLDQGFLKLGDSGNTIKYNVAVVPGSEYPTIEASNLILAAHNGPASKNNTYFRNIDKLKNGDIATVQYANKQYKYSLVKRYTSPKNHYTVKTVKIPKNSLVKQLTLITCNREKTASGRNTYDLNYLIEVFHLVSEIDCNGQC